MMSMKFTIELGAENPDAQANYECLEISKDSHGTIHFHLVGLNGRRVAHGSCEASELIRMAEILGEPEESP